MNKFARILFPCCLMAFLAAPACPQNARNERIIRAQATETITAPSEVATVKIGYANKAAAREDVYRDNVQASAKILQALLSAGVPATSIETQDISLEKETQEKPDGSSRVVGYSAEQQWRVHVTAASAQKTIDIAVAAGANEIQGVDWDVKDPKALEAKAYAAAMDRAKSIAEDSAAHMGVRLGQIVLIQNDVNRFSFPVSLNTESASLASRVVSSLPLTLYPQKIERQASVTVTYAIAE